MGNTDKREVWQRGPVDGIPPLLQPVAHALLQTVEDVERYTDGFPTHLLWERPANAASVGFHLLHIGGVIDRLFTYARAEALTTDQFAYLKAEKETQPANVQLEELVRGIHSQVEKALKQLKFTTESSLTEARELGRNKIPTTVIGLLFHAAEHAQRHVGQLLVTVRVLRSGQDNA